MKINQKSWHYKFAMAFRQEEIAPNLCAYARSLLMACINALLLATIGLGIIFGLGDMLGWLAAMIACLCWMSPTVIALFGIGFVGIVVGIFALLFFSEAESLAPIREAAKARKEMFCPRVEFDR